MIKFIVKCYWRFFFNFAYRRIRGINRRRKKLKNWIKKGKPLPLPPYLKQKTVISYAKRYSINILIETGTYRGGMIYATRKIFNKIYSIELDKSLYERAKNRFSKYNHISIFQGDSKDIIPIVLSLVKEPCIFWLDAHYAGVGTAKGEYETPIEFELKHIINSSNLNHIILIDDARCFTGKNGYPTINRLRDLILNNCRDRIFTRKEDIIRIHKK